MLLSLMLACSGPAEEACEGSGNICTWAGSGIAGLGGENTPALETNLYLPIDMEWSPDGVGFIIDWNNHRIRRMNEDGTLVSFAGTGELGDGPDGSPAVDGKFNHPTNITFDNNGDMLIAAWHNSRVMRITMDDEILHFVAGDGTRSYGGDGGDPMAAALNLPAAVVVDSIGQIYLSDQANQRIRCVTSAGVIDTIAGNGTAGYSGDGGEATEAEIHASVGQAASPANRLALSSDDAYLYFTDTENHRIRVVDLLAGTIDTFAGTGDPAYAGDGGDRLSASFYQPTDIAFGPEGEMYVADTSNSCVRRIDADGVVSTAAGKCGEIGYEGDGGAAGDALLNRPYGVALDGDGNLYISDTYNQVIRVVYK